MAGIRKLATIALALMTVLVLHAGGSSAATLARTTSRSHHQRTPCERLAAARERAAKRHRGGSKRSRCHRSKHRRRAHARRGTQGAQAQRPGSAVPASSTTAACEGATLTPDAANLELVRAATLCLINRERAARGERPLRANADLGHAAQGHSESMTAESYFEHASLDGLTPLGRARACGYVSGEPAAYEVGENIAWASLREATPAAIVAAWMASPPHRANILNGAFRDSGIGVSPSLPASFAAGQAGAIYTQDFGAIL